MKRQLTLLACLVLVFALVFSFAACKNNKSDDTHTHSYAEGKCECGATDPDYVAPHTHNFVEGKCECGESDPNYQAPECEHAYSSSTTKEPTCTEAGEKTYTCVECGHSYTQEIPANDHSKVRIPAVNPTCTETGLTEGYKCEVCGETLTAQETVPATGHNYVDGVCECGEADPDYNGPKTYTVTTSDMFVNNADGTQNLTDKLAIPAGSTWGTEGYFTITGEVVQRVKNNEYVYCVEVAKQGGGGITFTVTGTATVEINFHSTSGSNTSWIGLVDADGNLLTNDEGVNTVTGTGEGLTVHYTVGAGTYTVVSPALTDDTGADPYNRSARVYTISVKETPSDEHVNSLKVGDTNKIVVTGNTLNAFNLPVEWVAFTVVDNGTYTFVGDNGALAWIYDADLNNLCGMTGSAFLEAGTYLICVGNGAVGEFNVAVTQTLDPATHNHTFSLGFCKCGAECTHEFVDGVCSVCKAEDPNYVPSVNIGENDTVLNFSEWGGYAEGTYADGELQKLNKYFTFIHAAKSRIDANEKLFADNFAATQRFNFGGKTAVGAVPEKAALQITVDGPATLKLWWVSGGDGRLPVIMDAEGNVIASAEASVKNSLYITELAIPAAGTYYLGNQDGNNYWFKVELIPAEPVVPSYEELPLGGELELETTDTYGWFDDEYTFVAPATGVYTFKIPAGFGIWSLDSYNTMGSPELDYQLTPDGGTVSFELTEGQLFSFYLGGLSIDYVYVEVIFTEGTIGGGGSYNPTLGEEVALEMGTTPIEQANATYAYTAETDGTLTLSAGGAIMGNVAIYYNVNGGAFTALELSTSASIALSAGDKVVIAIEAEGYSSLTAAWVGKVDTYLDLSVGNTQINAENANYSYTASEDGTLTLSAGGAIMGAVEITYSVNGGDFATLALSSSVELALSAGDKVLVKIVAEGYSSLTVAWSNGGSAVVEPDGTEANPYIWETLPENVTFESDTNSMVYYVFTANVNGAITFTWPTADSWFGIVELDANGNSTANSTSGYCKLSHTFLIEAGKSYLVKLGTWNNAGEVTITISAVACEHSWSAASCSAPSTCANCGATTGDKLDHTPNVEEPTCSNPQVCTVCGIELGTANHELDYDNGVIKTPANCATETNGVIEYTCTVCGAKVEEELWAEHNMVTDAEVGATCTTAGYYKAHCANCDYVYEESSPAAGHWSYAYLACGESGVCAECGETYTKEHEAGWWGIEPGCITDGQCGDCGAVIPALGHTPGAAATCTTAQLCDVCFEVLAPAGHIGLDDIVCDACGETVIPEDGATLTISQALAIAKMQAHNTYTTNKYYITGVVISAPNATYGNTTIRDENGNELYVYGLYSADGANRYDAMAIKPVKGDTITVYTVLGTYNNASQGKNAWVTGHVQHTEHTWADATCKAPKTCTICDITEGDALDHTYVNGVCSGCGKEDGAVANIVLSVSTLGIASQSYAAGTTTLEGVGFEYQQMGNYGDGLQMRDKDGKTSKIWNTTAFAKPIAKIEIVLSSTKSVYNNSNAVIFTFGNAVGEATYTTKLSTTASTLKYTITPDAETYTFFQLEHDLSYTFYYESITIVFADGTSVQG